MILPHVIGDYEELTKRNVTWEQIVEHTEIVLAFGGMALKNSMVGRRRHQPARRARRHGARRARAAAEFVLVSPLRDDLPEEAGAEWISNIPGTDTALMLALAHTLVVEGLHDRAFLDRYTRRLAGVRALSPGRDRRPAEGRGMGRRDHRRRRPTRSSRWRAELHGRRALIVVSQSLQRAEHGEQPVWMGAVLAAMLGQIGLPGGGYGYALGAIAHYGTPLQCRAAADAAAGRATASPTSSRSRASPTCCSIRASPSTTTARR